MSSVIEALIRNEILFDALHLLGPIYKRTLEERDKTAKLFAGYNLWAQNACSKYPISFMQKVIVIFIAEESRKSHSIM